MTNCRNNLIRFGAALAVSGWLLAGNVFPASADSSVSGAAMRLSSREGAVTVRGKGGKEMDAFDNMRLQSGYSLETGAGSYAGLTLDDTKAVKIDALSKGEIRKKGKQLELLLSAGSLLCNVTAPLEGDETLSIRTSTMITGIRGTVVYANVIDSFTSRVCVLEGQVLVQSPDPAPGEENGVYISQGQQALIYGAGDSRGSGGVQTFSLLEEDIAPYVLWEIHENENLADRLRETGWDVDWILEHAEERLRQEEDKNTRLLEEDEKGVDSSRGGKDTYYPLFGGGDSDSGSDSGHGEERPEIELTLPLRLGTIEYSLRSNDVILRRSEGNDRFIIEGSLTVPTGSRLEVESGIDVLIENNSRLEVNGTLVIEGELNNKGTITNTSMNTLDLRGDYRGSGHMRNRGRMLAGGSFFLDGGSFINSGPGCLEVEGDAAADWAQLDFGSGRTIFKGDLDCAEIEGETGDNVTVEGQFILKNSNMTIKGGQYKGGISVENTELEMKGGTVKSGAHSYAIRQESAEADTVIILSGGSVLAEEGAAAAVSMNEGQITVKSGILQVSDESIPFVTGTGILKIGGVEYQDWDDLIYESEIEDDVWVLTGVKKAEENAAGMTAKVQEQPAVNALPAVPNEKEPAEEIKTQTEQEKGNKSEEEVNKPAGEMPEAGGARPEGETPEEGETGPEGETPEEGETGPEGETPEEGETGPEGETPEAGETGPEGE